MTYSDKKVILCGVVKNVQLQIKKNIDLAIETGKHFADYKVVVYENNSTDRTKEILQQYSSYDHVKIVSENIENYNKKENNKLWTYTEVTGSDHPCRIEHICNARKKLINEINQPEYDSYEHVIMIDLDSSGWEISGILNSFHTCSHWDVIFANSFEYYDYYALRIEGFIFGPEIVGESFWNLPNYSFQRNSECVPVYSAFNGIGIYKKDIFKKYSYDFEVNEHVKTFYRNYMKNHTIHPNVMNVITDNCNKFTDGYKDEESDIYWKSNSGYKGQVVCEHTPLHFALYNAGYKLCINPNMVYYR